MNTRLLAVLLAALGATAALTVTAFAFWPLNPSRVEVQTAKMDAAAVKADAPVNCRKHPVADPPSQLNPEIVPPCPP